MRDLRTCSGSTKARGMARAVLLACTVAYSACSGKENGASSGSWVAQVDTVGDTITVTTLRGSEWGAAVLTPELKIGRVDGADHELFGALTGIAVSAQGEILLYDAQVPALRRFAADGQYLGTLGRSGSGPGEYTQSDGGLVILGDGRIVLRDPRNGRLTVFTPDGAHAGHWPIPSGRFTSTPMVPATDGGFYNPTTERGQASRMMRYAADGTALDSVPNPEPRVATASVRAEVEGASQTWRVPFTPVSLLEFHPSGYFLSAVSRLYAIDALRRDGHVVRIRRAEPLDVPVSDEERAAEEQRVTKAMRRLDPKWQWNGVPIPRSKPALRALYAGHDGRIWVLLHQPGEPVPPDELEPEPGGGTPTPRFREPIVFDVFEEDGRYLGRVSCPIGFSTSPRPVFRGDYVWAMERDTLGVQQAVRYRVTTHTAPVR
jgi:hypothetical protein